MMRMTDAQFTVHFKDEEGKDHFVEVVAHSGTHAILLAMEEVSYLKFHPNHLYRVTKETT